MPKIFPFQGVHFDWRRAPLSRVVCPPYDVISKELDRQLRRMPYNTIHIELPQGQGSKKYTRAKNIWERWKREGVLVRDEKPSFYVIEQKFSLRGKTYKRTGILGALSLDGSSMNDVIPHEKTLPKPKEDRLHLLRALKLNTSPIFAIYPDPRQAARKCLNRVMASRATAAGDAPGGVHIKLWRVDDPSAISKLKSALESKVMLIADGHHRLEVAKEYYRLNRRGGGANRGEGASKMLCYFCAEEDRGLLVLPTHRVLAHSEVALKLAKKQCRFRHLKSLRQLEKALARQASPFAYGLLHSNSSKTDHFVLAVPTERHTAAKIRTGLGVEWLAKRVLPGVDPQNIRYTHERAEALAWSRESGGAALLVKPIHVSDIRKAVKKAGLLPQKSTYFYPKIHAGAIFKEA